MSLSEVKVSIDCTQFPMFWSESIEAYVSCVPITKIQFEYFLCGVRHPRFNADFYDELLSRNQRVSPGKLLPKNYHHAFITGVKPTEAVSYAEWASSEGEDIYELPTSEEWRSISAEWKEMADPTTEIYAELKLTRRAKQLLDRLDKCARQKQNVSSDRNLAHFAIMNHGILEWVHWEGGRFGWGGMGFPHSEFKAGFTIADNDVPQDPTDIESRPAAYGFRLIKREI